MHTAKEISARKNGQLGLAPIKHTGQEKWTSGNELRWVAGTDESGPAVVAGPNGEIKFRGTYAAAVKWLTDRACRPVSGR